MISSWRRCNGIGTSARHITALLELDMNRYIHRTAIAICLSTSLAANAQSTPKTGAEVLQRMHDAYAGKWYRSLTFVQKTTQFKKDGTVAKSTWYESLRQVDPTMTQLRIDFGDPAAGNGTLYTADSTWVV